MFESRDLDGVRVLRMAHGKANTLDTEFLAALQSALSTAESDAIDAVVLTGTGSIFSAGVDLFRVVAGGRSYLEVFLPALSTCIRQLFTFPKPVAAAINGHAIAGGCILACACDVRIGTREGCRIGVPELRVGVPFPAAALEVVRFAVGTQRLPEVVFAEDTFSPDQALATGLLDRLVDPEDLLDSAVSTAQGLSGVGARAFAFTKRQLRRETIESIRREGERSDAEVLAMWSEPDTQARIRTYLDRTLGGR